MNAKINKRGNLLIERRGLFKSQYCPYVEDDPCGDWCPRFIEDNPMETFDKPNIFVCGQSLILIIDERKEK